MSGAPTSWPCPVAPDDSTAVVALAKAVRDPDAAIYAIRLWHHRRRCGAGLPDLATAEGICRWRGKRGALGEALQRLGFVATEGDRLVIVPWEQVAFVDWTRSGGENPDEVDRRAARRAADARRKRDRRAADKADVRTASAPRPQDVRTLSAADAADDTPLIARATGSRTVPVSEGEDPPCGPPGGGTPQQGTLAGTGSPGRRRRKPPDPAAHPEEAAFVAGLDLVGAAYREAFGAATHAWNGRTVSALRRLTQPGPRGGQAPYTAEQVALALRRQADDGFAAKKLTLVQLLSPERIDLALRSGADDVNTRYAESHRRAIEAFDFDAAMAAMAEG